MEQKQQSESWWTAVRGPGSVVATAIHDGHGLRNEAAAAMALPEDERLREEDPFTGQCILPVPNHIIGHRSRFEFDLNRDVENAVYVRPEQSWGLKVWHQKPEQTLIDGSLAIHAAYYRMLGGYLDDLREQCRRFVVIDVHSYNHRRDGPDAPPAPQKDMPDINIGTFSMPREEWAWLVDPLIEEMRDFDFNGRKLDVRENVAFQGKGEQTRFIHDRYPGTGCAIALEFKKFFMDEWTGEPDPAELSAMQDFIAHIADRAQALLDS